MHSLARLRALWLQRNRMHVLPPVLTLLTRLTALDVTGNDIIYDATAARIAALPRLRKLNFPAPCEAFSWDSKKARSPCQRKASCRAPVRELHISSASRARWRANAPAHTC
jgi:hypothetical protein